MRFYCLTILLVFNFSAYCQDQITTKDKEIHICRIVEEDKKTVAFYLMSDANKEIRYLDKKSVKKIKYEKPSMQINTIVITDDSKNSKELFSSVVSYLINSGYEIKTFDKDLLEASAMIHSKFRISVEVENNQTYFSCYISDEEEDTRPSHSKSNVIRLSSENKATEKEKYPGEKKDRAGGKTFDDMDKICRLFLKENKGSMVYKHQ